MCKVVIRREMLGAREQSWSCWTGVQSGIKELKASEIKKEIASGNKVCGLKVGEDGELELDRDVFYTRNVVEHRQSDNFRMMMEEENGIGNVAMVCVGSHQEGERTVYDCINNRFGMEKLSADDIRIYLRLGIVCSGAMMNDNGEILVASTVYPKVDTPVQETEPAVEEVVPIEETEEVEEIAVDSMDSLEENADMAEVEQEAEQADETEEPKKVQKSSRGRKKRTE